MRNQLSPTRSLSGQGVRKPALAAALAASVLAPSFAFAGGEASVRLKFTQQDYIYLGISFAFALIAIIVAFFLAQKISKMSPGDEKMQEVGGAIYAGAMAYLRKQITTMLIFVGALSVLLFFLYQGQFGAQWALGTAAAFIGGVAASYIAGFAGMIMAVRGNMRTANAALTSYKAALEVAFRSGAVAGLLTVGMGLLGATVIFLVGGEFATRLLIGFGFGGSLAALFMRVGGGIFTKAADVGADLVGKVEAGIPEDDPRNPAVIADNVGDNVGDCAGMAADVFESYEVTLVAAIVLGAALSAILPQAEWMRLILFAMMARGVGIIASIWGIFNVKGSDDLKVDPLTQIRKGFYSSAVIAALLTAGLAWFMLGGFKSSETVQARQLVPVSNLQIERSEDLRRLQQTIATEKKVAKFEVTPQMIQSDKRVEAIGDFAGDEGLQRLQQSLAPARGEKIDVERYRLVDATDKEGVAGKIAVNDPAQAEAEAKNPPQQPSEPKVVTLAEGYAGRDLVLMSLKISRPQVDAQGKPVPNTAPQTQDVLVGPVDKAGFMAQIEQARKQDNTLTVSIEGEYKAELFADGMGNVIAGFAVDPKEVDLAKAFPQPLGFKATPEEVQSFRTKSQSDPTLAMTGGPEQVTPQLAYIKTQPAYWWQFLLCLVFGIVMAFGFEVLTDYYVSFHKRPVREVADVSTAGPAPMIISGFAYGKESSVFSVFAIVICLIVPLLVFRPDLYGGYLLSFYGIALVGLGLLTTTGFILAMDTFGPISDNAQGVFEMSGKTEEYPEGARRVQLLDAAGNTTKALTKGFAIATAVVAATALFHAFVEEGQLTTVGMRLEIPEIFLGVLIGGAAPYLFSAFSIQAVGRAAFDLINEVRRQFRNDPGIMAGTSKPDYAACVAISTGAAQKELLGPGILAIAFPVLVAFGLSIGKPLTEVNGVEYNLVGAQALGGFLVGAIVSGQLLAVMLANSGGLWDNSKKLIEDGLHGGKGTEAHKAAVVCDTVGDPFKDTAGPALNPLIKVMNLVALLLAPLVIQPQPIAVQIGVTLAAVAALTVAIVWSKRGGMGSSLNEGQAQPAAVGATATPAPTASKEEDKAE